RDDHVVRMLRADPEVVVVVAARRALDDREGLAAVGRLVNRLADRVDGVGLVRLDREPAHVPGRDRARLVYVLPVPPGVVGAVEAAVVFVVDRGVEPRRAARKMRGGDADAAEFPFRPILAL